MRGKRAIHRNVIDPSFVRRADGRLRPAQEADIKDIWAGLERIKLKEAIEKDTRKRARKQRRREFLGSVKATRNPTVTDDGAKTVEIKIHVPELSLSQIVAPFVKTASRLGCLSKKQKGIIIGIVVFLSLFAASFSHYGDKPKVAESDPGQTVINGVQGVQNIVPPYRTVLPIHTTIDDLGGWSQVSPPDKDPVYAFTDQIEGVKIVVSQQPLPESFKASPEGKIANLAQDFSANEKITAGETQAYVGTSAQGPQSVILTKNSLLILVKSASRLSNRQWEQYLATLQ